MKSCNRFWTKVLLACGIVGVGLVVGVEPTGVAFVPNKADAIVGRPLTPVSYAGVARRTVRRTTYVAGAAAAATYTAARLSTLPPGCVLSAGIYRCGAVSYRAVYDGPDVVYVQN